MSGGGGPEGHSRACTGCTPSRYGDTFLPDPDSYDQLYYEIIRVHQVRTDVGPRLWMLLRQLGSLLSV